MKCKFDDYAVHIAFSTNPLGESSDFITHIENEVYEKHKMNFKNQTGQEYSEISLLYKPIKFTIFGHYDLLFLSLIDSYKFAQKVFYGIENQWNGTRTINYQVQVGSKIFDDQRNLLDFFKLVSDDRCGQNLPFISIVNLKLNNGLLIGNGIDFANPVLDRIKVILNGMPYLILHTYNWCEFTVILLSDNAQHVGTLIQSIRNIKVEDISELYPEIIENSLYYELLPNDEKDKIGYSDCFVETQTYFGIRYELFSGDGKTDLKLDTSVEWQVKPGHFDYFKHEIERTRLFEDKFYIKTGKTDCVTEVVNKGALESNMRINQELRKPDSSLAKHVRKMKTTPLFEPKFEESRNEGISNFQYSLKKFCVRNISEWDEQIRFLNLPRQLRMKILKLIHNYNQSILDPINYIYYIDFYNFMNTFKRDISGWMKKVENGQASQVAFLAHRVSNYVNVFEDAYFDRILNNSVYEDLNDFSIDFNSSVTGILSSLDTIVKFISKSFGEDNPHILLRVNDENTESNFISINYDVHQLIDIPMVVSAVVKEILNSTLSIIDRDGEGSLWEDIAEIVTFQARDVGFIIDVEYFSKLIVNDAIRALYTYNLNHDLFKYWHWVISLQNSKQYYLDGKLVEDKMVIELLRYCLISKLVFNVDVKEAPHAFTQSVWDNYCNSITIFCENICKRDDFNKYFITCLDYIFDTPNFSSECLLTSSFNIFTAELDSDSLVSTKAKFSQDVSNILARGERSGKIFKWRVTLVERLLKLSFSSNISGLNRILIDNEESNILKVNAVIYFVLVEYMNIYTENVSGKENPILRRKMHEVDDKFVKECSYNVFIDPQGGIYIKDMNILMKKMRLNHEFYYLLWDLACKLKKDLFKLD